MLARKNEKENNRLTTGTSIPSRQPDEVFFWDQVGSSFPSLEGATSTRYYFECERLLFEQFFPDLKERKLFKTDLWDEAKNTEILHWATEAGARPIGVDIAISTATQARAVLLAYFPWIVAADIRRLPFKEGVFDLIYSMGTIEHFSDYEVAVRELFRVLKPEGTAIIGVPNRLDPFLRPLLVCILQRLGLYAYGQEKSFTQRALRRLLEAAGFRVKAQTGWDSVHPGMAQDARPVVPHQGATPGPGDRLVDPTLRVAISEVSNSATTRLPDRMCSHQTITTVFHHATASRQ